MSSKDMFIKLAKDISIDIIATALIVFLLLFVLHCCFNIEIQISAASTILGAIGIIISFIGSEFVSDALSRLGSVGLPQYRIGNRMQAVGFALAIAALFVR